MNFFTIITELKIFLLINKEIFLEILYQFLVLLKNSIIWYEIIFDLKLLMNLFLVINPFDNQITYAIHLITRPMFRIGRNFWPTLFDYDITFMYNLYILKKIYRIICFTIKRLESSHRIMSNKRLEFLYNLYKS